MRQGKTFVRHEYDTGMIMGKTQVRHGYDMSMTWGVTIALNTESCRGIERLQRFSVIIYNVFVSK